MNNNQFYNSNSSNFPHPPDSKKNLQNIKYLDIDSTFRDRINYPNQNNFVIPINYIGKNNNRIDPIVTGLPYTNSSKSVGTNTTQTSVDASHIVLDSQESSINNYYINSYLEINGEFRKIISYDSVSKTAIVNNTFSSTPSNNTLYRTRKDVPIFIGTVSNNTTPTYNTFSLSSGSPVFDDFYNNAYLRFLSNSNNPDLIYKIIDYEGTTQTVTLDRALPNLPLVNDNLEILSFNRDNANSLNGIGGTGNSSTLYELELLWLSVPNQLLSTSYGGTLDCYPYIYLSIFNPGNPLSTQIMYSNNPNSALAVFKIPIDETFDNSSFLILKHSKSKPILNINPEQDLKIVLTLPDGNILDYVTKDNLSPYETNPLLQTSFLMSFRKIKS